MSRRQVALSFNDEEYQLFQAYRARLGAQSDYEAARKAVMTMATAILTGEKPKFAEAKPTSEGQIEQTRTLIERLLDQAGREEAKLFKRRSGMIRSGRYNPSFTAFDSEEGTIIRKIDYKREKLAQKMKTLSMLKYYIERVQNKDWEGEDTKLPRRSEFTKEMKEELT